MPEIPPKAPTPAALARAKNEEHKQEQLQRAAALRTRADEVQDEKERQNLLALAKSVEDAADSRPWRVSPTPNRNRKRGYRNQNGMLKKQ